MPKKFVTIPIFVPHLGCGHRCSFCDQTASTSVNSQPDSDYVRQKTESYLSGINKSVEHIEIAFFGGSFTGIPIDKQTELLKATHVFLMQGRINGIRVSTRPDYIDDDKLAVLIDHGVTIVELGVQSFSNRVLAAANRGHTSADTYRAVETLKRNRMDFVIQLMPGLPQSSLDDDIASAEISAGLGPAAVRIYPAVVLKNTGMEALYSSGGYTPLSLPEAVSLCSRMVKIFDSSSIPVIRIGIHPLADSAEDNIVAGPYHPSFGFFVKSFLKREILEDKIKSLMAAHAYNISKINLTVPNYEKEEYIGFKRENLNYLKNHFKLDEINVSFSNTDETLSTIANNVITPK